MKRGPVEIIFFLIFAFELSCLSNHRERISVVLRCVRARLEKNGKQQTLVDITEPTVYNLLQYVLRSRDICKGRCGHEA
jgi:hypothetical protein